MIVLIEETVWAEGAADPLELLALVEVCAERRHVLLLEPKSRQKVFSWMDAHLHPQSGIRQRIHQILEENQRRSPNALPHDARRGRLDHQTLVNTLKALLDLSIYGSDLSAIIQKIHLQDGSTPVLDQMEQGVRAAVEFLAARCNIRSESALPYAYQLVALAYAAARGDDLAAASEPLRQWTYTEHFTGMTAGQLRRAFEHVRRICAGGALLPPEMQPLCSPLVRFHPTSVRALAFMHLLARQKLSDERGTLIDGAEVLARGGEAFNLLYPEHSASDPANRILVAPGHAAAVRQALSGSLPFAPSLREAHVLPPWNDPAASSAQTTLDWRRARLREMETGFIQSLGLTVRTNIEPI